MTKKAIVQLFPQAKIIVKKANQQEIREGWFVFEKEKWPINKGIVYAPLKSKPVLREQKSIRLVDKIPQLGGSQRYNQAIFFRALENLPQGSNNPLFTKVGAFLNISLGAQDYFNFLAKLKGKLTILEIGSDSGWSCARLAKQGHQVVGLDISHHLKLRDFWLQKKKVYFDSVCGDMNNLPFKDNVFDLVFASASIHHSPHLFNLSQQIWRVLKPRGQFVFLREPMKGKWAKGKFGQKQKNLGICENLYSSSYWFETFQKTGFRNIKIDIAQLDYEKIAPKLSFKQKLIFRARQLKKYLLRKLPILQNFTISDFNFSGQKPKNRL